MATSSGKFKAVIHAGERTLTPQELIQLILKDRDQAEKALAEGIKIEAPRAVIDAIRQSPVGEHVGDDGSVEVSAFTSLEIVLVVAIVITGFFVGWNAGFADGQEAGQAQTKDEGEGDGDGEGGRGEGEGEGGGEGGEGGGGGGGGEGGGGEGG